MHTWKISAGYCDTGIACVWRLVFRVELTSRCKAWWVSCTPSFFSSVILSWPQGFVITWSLRRHLILNLLKPLLLLEHKKTEKLSLENRKSFVPSGSKCRRICAEDSPAVAMWLICLPDLSTLSDSHDWLILHPRTAECLLVSLCFITLSLLGYNQLSFDMSIL